MVETLLVNEVFWSLQGEGAFVGTPSVFIRLQGCDVGCPWCDTGYARELDKCSQLPDCSDDVFARKKVSSCYSCVSLEWLLERILSKKTLVAHAVITGGEPCRQDLRGLSAGLLAAGVSVQVETSGTSPIDCSPGTWITLSPKAARVLPENWEKASEVKLPVQDVTDVIRWEKQLGALDCRKIWLQPVSRGEAATSLCIRECMARNWRLSIQMHKYLNLQ